MAFGSFCGSKDGMQVLRKKVSLAALSVAAISENVVPTDGGESTEFSMLSMRACCSVQVW